MRKLTLIIPLVGSLAGCGGMPSSMDSNFLQSLAKDPATACVAIGPIPPYFGGLFYARAVPSANGNMEVDCGLAKIGGGSGLSGLPAGTVITIPRATQ